jgi:hypothetical protein
MSEIPKTQDLLDFSLNLSKVHLEKLLEKAKSHEGLTPHEGNCINTYVRTFSAILKSEKLDEANLAKDVSKLTDEELKKELEKFVASSAEKESEDEV